MRSIVSLVSALVLLVGMAPAKADDVATCDKGSGEEKIAACSRLISSGKFKGHNLAIVFNHRGDAHYGKGDYDRAVADYSEAIRLDPKHAFAYIGRGLSYRMKGDYDRAIADHSEAIRLVAVSPISLFAEL